ncbi:TetR/AcrR family transcriptional regulator [Anaerocolumna sp. AGMB13025]|uniref:TetR/AcrR family transcriptional regulator n=1 Tax=Anaerocolumna sp. AGMB13025 TaxID=3039116 RepID=UPI002420285E|nr:TetR/AcrR family transcriptional regulator [Anaerocolumna sp. AGMB13025]WFR55717.1 TetR/AcrR family transcriptional regulator [Anaerocolumna sp. AGMB13025]
MKEKAYHHGNLRNQLIESGIELINEEGLSGFSLRKVAAKCEVSHTAPYSHFKDINGLIGAMGEHVTNQFMDKLHTAILNRENSPEAILLLGQAYIDFFLENPQYFQFLFYHSGITIDLDSESPEDYPPFALFRTTAYQLFRSRGMSETGFSKMLISLWSVVHGIASLLSNNGVSYSGDWQDIFRGFINEKEENL